MNWVVKRLSEEMEFRGYSQATIACYKAGVQRYLKGNAHVLPAAIKFLKSEILCEPGKLTEDLPAHQLHNRRES